MKYSKVISPIRRAAIAAFITAASLPGCTNHVLLDDINKITNDSVAIDKQTIGGVSAIGGTGTVTLSWTMESSATGYFVYYSTTQGGCESGSRISTSASPMVLSLSAGTTYYFCVAGYDDSDASNFLISAVSSEVSATPL